MKVYRKLAKISWVHFKDPLSFPSLKKRELPDDYVWEPVPVTEEPKTRWEELRDMIVREWQYGQWKGGPGYYDTYRNFGKNYVSRDNPQSIQELRLFRNV